MTASRWRPITNRALRTLLSAALMMCGLVLLAPAARATMPHFQLPFPCGETWHASTYAGHNAIDWNDYPEDAGRPVVASASGNAVAGWNSGYGYYVTITHADGWQTRYGHLSAPGVSGAVSQGQVIGSVGNTGNSTGAHLHWEQILNGAARSTLYANGAALTPGTSATPSAPAYTSANCAPRSVDRIGTLNGASVDVKEGALNATWSHIADGQSFQMSPNRVALYTGDRLLIKEGPLNAQWVEVTGAVDSYQVTDNRIGIMVSGKLYIKEGPLSAGWVLVGTGNSFDMSPNRIALYNGGQLLIKEGPLNATWVAVTGAVSSYDLTDNRIGVMAGGQLSIKEGPLGAAWTVVGGGDSFVLSPNRIAVYGSGQLAVKEGPLNATWVTVAGQVDAFDVTDNRVGVLVAGELKIKEGPLGATWALVGGGSAFELT